MLFNSLDFIIFWIVVVCVYYLIPSNKMTEDENNICRQQLGRIC